MDIQELDKVFVHLGLGHIVPELGRVTGGLLHRMWRVSATSGDYAVKQLSGIILERPRARTDYINSEKISRFMASKCLPAIPAITFEDNPLHLCGNDSIMIFKWFEGSPKPSGVVEAEYCEQIGVVLGSIHSNQPETMNLDPPAFAFFDERHWRLLLDRARNIEVAWLNDAESAIDMLIEISCEYSKIAGELRKEQVISHRDMDQKNVLWKSTGEIAVIDWESAGMQNPALDLLDTALNWCGMAKDEDGMSSFKALVGGYLSVVSKHPRTPGYTALLACLGNWLHWLEFNMQQSLLSSLEADELAMRMNEVETTLCRIYDLNSRSQQLVELYEGCCSCISNRYHS